MEEKNSMKGQVISINISTKKGEVKKPVPEAKFIEDFGIQRDAHGGASVKQVSLLAQEVINQFEEKAGVEVTPGAFAENLTVEGIDLAQLKVGSCLRLGEEILLNISQFGKKCHEDCAIKELTGECIMPTKGVFAKVLRGGQAKKGDRIEVQND